MKVGDLVKYSPECLMRHSWGVDVENGTCIGIVVRKRRRPETIVGSVDDVTVEVLWNEFPERPEYEWEDDLEVVSKAPETLEKVYAPD